MRFDTTAPRMLSEQVGAASPQSGAPEPGLLLVFSAGQPYCALLPLGSSATEIGRGQGALSELPDASMSRRHAHVSAQGDRFVVIDLDSRNGSAINAVPLRGRAEVGAGTLVRLGESLFLCCADLRPYRQLGVTVTGPYVRGPALQVVSSTVAHIATSSRVLHICGESGTGKESLAHAFHHSGPQSAGRLIAVNCAAIPEGIAERLLFGVRKGAFSGAVQDSEGYIEAANGGTLFLDEIAELDAVVQGKLLRVIETGELLPLGMTRPRKVQFCVCTATHRDLRSLAEAGSFRRDLYFRIGMPMISLPPLCQRREEIPWLIRNAVQAAASDLAADVSLVETCMLRRWPGNIRELLAEVSAATLKGRAAGSARVMSVHLTESAGMAMPSPQAATRASAPRALSAEPAAIAESDRGQPAAAASSVPTAPSASPPDKARGGTFAARPNRDAGGTRTRQQILAALLATQGNLSAAARDLGIHRTQLRRLLTRHRIDLHKVREWE